MTSDYNAIRAHNIREYGEGVRHLAFLGKLYSDRTHFILELLQNAEDAHATHVRFDMFADCLEFRHDGRLFTPDDVEGICGVDLSTKSTDLTAIGKFGVGFKSVYAYTAAPTIHSGDEHFAIRHFVRPESAPTRADVDADETLQVFPFDNPDVERAAAFTEITEALNALDSTTLLFLRNVTEVTLITSGSQRTLRRDVVHTTPVTIRTSSIIGSDEDSHTWWLFEKLHTFEGHTGLPVQIAFALDEIENTFYPARREYSPLSVFFPTEKETHLGFLLQGPFRTTPARDNVPAADPWNTSLVACASDLVIEALRELRALELLTMEVLTTLPTRTAQFTQGGMFDPIYMRVIDALRSEELIPTNSGQHTRARDARLPRTAAVRNLFTDHDLTTLLGTETRHRWLPPANTIEPALLRLIRGVLQIHDMDLEALLRHTTAEFFESKSDDWMIEFYAALKDIPSLYRQPQYRQAPVLARERPIIRLRSGKHVNPFSNTGEPNAFLPTDNGASNFPTVNDHLASDEASRTFLEDLGLGEPDAIVEVERFILPTYTDTGVPAGDAKINADWERIGRALNSDTATPTRRRVLVAKLKATPLLKCVCSTGFASMVAPRNAYRQTPELEMYFYADPTKPFVAAIYDKYERLLQELGVSASVRVTARPPNTEGQVTIRNAHGSHARGLSGFDPDIDIDGLATALSAPTAERSAFIWNRLLAPRAAVLTGEIETSTRQDFGNARKRPVIPKITDLLRSSAWLPHQDHGFVSPDKLSLADLSNDFARNEMVASALGMQTSLIGEASSELGIPIDVLRYLQDNPDQVAELAKSLQKTHARTDAAGRTGGDESAVQSGCTFPEAVRSAFEKRSSPRPIVDAEDLEIEGHGRVRNPSLRRERVIDSLSAAGENDSAPTLRLSLRTAHDPRDESVRAFMTDQYGGRCQICRSTFVQTDGSSYFEAFHLAERKLGPHADRPGGVLCLCPTCCRKFQFGTVQVRDLDEQIRSWRTLAEGGNTDPKITLTLCGESATLRFTEKHFVDLQELFRFERKK